MPSRSALGIAALGLLLAGMPFAQAQGWDPRYPGSYGQDPRSRPVHPADPYAAQGRGHPARPPTVNVPGYPGYYPGKLIQPAPQQPGSGLRRLFGLEDPPPPVVQPDRHPQQRVSPRPARARSQPPAAAARQEKPKVDPSTFVVVFGDSLADLVGQGLDESFGEAEEVAVVRKTRADSGLVRQDVQDWPKAIQEVLNGGQKVSVAVVMLGVNDRQAIREGDAVHEALSERWRELYGERVDAVARVFRERGIPFVWVGAPPTKNERLSTDLMSINEIVRDRVRQAGGVYVDVWPGFVDDDNRYTATGPDVNGQMARLRSSDGVHFSRAGARKAAHFADVEIKRLIEAKRAGAGVAGEPPKPDSAGQGDQLINAVLPSPDLPGERPAAAKPVAGPVLPLTGPDVSPGGALLSGSARPGDAAETSRRALRDGIAPSPRPGRADDFRWPRS